MAQANTDKARSAGNARTAHADKADPKQADPKSADPKSADPKAGGTDASNRIKDPDTWTTGAEPMTGAQASYLKTLSEETGEAKAFDPDLDKAEASKRIDSLRKEAGRA